MFVVVAAKVVIPPFWPSVVVVVGPTFGIFPARHRVVMTMMMSGHSDDSVRNETVLSLLFQQWVEPPLLW